MGEITKLLITQEDANCASITRSGNSMIELETALGRLLMEDVPEGVQNHVLTSDSDDKVYPVLNAQQKSDCSTKTHGSLTKSATFPSSGKTLSYALNGRYEIPAATLHGQCSQMRHNPSCSRSTSMPNPPMKLISAMKGTREQQQGTPRFVKLNVTWAPDVYDPPSKSLSHTVQSHHQRHKTTKRKDQKHKHKGKSKSPRGSSNEKKQHHLSNKRSIGGSTTDLMQLRSQDFGNRTSPLGGFDQPRAEVRENVASCNRILPLDGFDQQNGVVPSIKVTELSVGGQDSKCGSSFRASFAKVHVSVAEAT